MVILMKKTTKSYVAFFLACLLLATIFIPPVSATGALYTSVETFGDSVSSSATNAPDATLNNDTGYYEMRNEDDTATIKLKLDAGKGSALGDTFQIQGSLGGDGLMAFGTNGGGAEMIYEFDDLVAGEVTISFNAYGGSGANIVKRWSLLDDHGNEVLCGGNANNSDLGVTNVLECANCAAGSCIGHKKSDETNITRDYMYGNGHQRTYGWYKIHLNFNESTATFERANSPSWVIKDSQWETYYGWEADASKSAPYVMALGSNRGIKAIKFNFNGSTTVKYIVDDIRVTQTSLPIDREALAKKEAVVTAAKTASGAELIAALDSGISVVDTDLATKYVSYNSDQKAYVAAYVAANRPTSEDLETAASELANVLEVPIREITTVLSLKEKTNAEMKAFLASNTAKSILTDVAITAYNNLTIGEQERALTVFCSLSADFKLPSDVSAGLLEASNDAAQPKPGEIYDRPIPAFVLVNGAKNVHPKQSLRISFAPGISAKDANKIILKNSGGTQVPVTASVSYDGTDVVIKPNSDLSANTTYILTVPEGTISSASSSAYKAIGGTLTFSTGSNSSSYQEENFNRYTYDDTSTWDIINGLKTTFDIGSKGTVAGTEIISESVYHDAVAAGIFNNGTGFNLQSDGSAKIVQAAPAGSSATSNYIVDFTDAASGRLQIGFDLILHDVLLANNDAVIKIANPAGTGDRYTYYSVTTSTTGYMNVVAKDVETGIGNNLFTWTHADGTEATANEAKAKPGRYSFLFDIDLDTGMADISVVRTEEDGTKLYGHRQTAQRKEAANVSDQSCGQIVFSAYCANNHNNGTDGNGINQLAYGVDNIFVRHFPENPAPSVRLATPTAQVELSDAPVLAFTTSVTEKALSGKVTVTDKNGNNIAYVGTLDASGLYYTITPVGGFQYNNASYTVSFAGCSDWSGKVVPEAEFAFKTIPDAGYEIRRQNLIHAAKTGSVTALRKAIDEGISDINEKAGVVYATLSNDEKAYVAEYVATHRPTAEEFETAMSQLNSVLDVVITQLDEVKIVRNGGEAQLVAFLNSQTARALLDADAMTAYNNLEQSQKDDVISVLAVMQRGFYLPQDISISLFYAVNRVLNPIPEGTVIHPVPTFSITNGEKNVHPDQPLHVSFNWPMKAKDMGSIVLTKGVGNVIATRTEASIDGSNVTIIPTNGLEPNTTYTISVPPNAIMGYCGSLGTAVASSVTFTTGTREGYYNEENYNNVSSGNTMVDVILGSQYGSATKVRLDDGAYDINSVSSWTSANEAGQFENGAGLYLRNDGRVDLIEANPKTSEASSGNIYYILDIDDVSTGGIRVEFDVELLDTQVGSADYFFGINNGATYGANGNYWQLGFQNGVLKAYSNGESLANGALIWTNEAGEVVSENVAGKLVAGQYHISFYTNMSTGVGNFVVRKETADGVLIGKRSTVAYVPTTGFESCSLLVFKASYQTEGGLYNYTDDLGNKKNRYILDNISTRSIPSATIAAATLTSNNSGVGLYDNQTIRFATPMTEAGLKEAISLTDPSGKVIPFSGNISEDGLTYTLISDDAFLYKNGTYTITISGAVDWSGQVMTTQNLTFTTVATAQAIESSIDKNAKHVHPDSQIVLQFGTAMNTENMKTITLKRQNGWEEPFFLQMSRDGSDVVLVPEKGLKPLTNYIITIPGDTIATKADGAVKAVATSINFTTGRDEGFYLIETYNQHSQSNPTVWEITEGTRYTYWGGSMLNMDSGTYVDSAASYEKAKLNGQFDEGAGLFMREDGAIDFIEASVGQTSRYGESVYKMDFQDVTTGCLQVEFDLELPGDQVGGQTVLFSISNKSSMGDGGAYWWLGFDDNANLFAKGRGESGNGALTWTKADGTSASDSAGKLKQGKYHVRLNADLDTGIGEFTVIKTVNEGQFVGKRITEPITKLEGFEACDALIFKNTIKKNTWGTVSVYNTTNTAGKRVNQYTLDNITTRYSNHPGAFIATENQLIEPDGMPIIAFNTPMTEDALSGKVLLKDIAGKELGFIGILSQDGYTYSMVTNESLTGNAVYTVTVLATTDWSGNGVAEQNLTFTTSAAPIVSISNLKLYAKTVDREQSVTQLLPGEKVITSATFANHSEADVKNGILYIGVYNAAGKLLKVSSEQLDISVGDERQITTTFIVPEDIGTNGYVKIYAWNKKGGLLCNETKLPY